MTNQVESAAKYYHSVVDLATNSTIVAAAGGTVRGVYLHDNLAYDLLLTDNAVTVFKIPSGLGAGSFVDLGDVRFETDVTVDPNDAATGTVTVIYRPSNQIKNWES